MWLQGTFGKHAFRKSQTPLLPVLYTQDFEKFVLTCAPFLRKHPTNDFFSMCDFLLNYILKKTAVEGERLLFLSQCLCISCISERFFFPFGPKNVLSLFVKETRHICALPDRQGDYGGCIIGPLSARAQTLATEWKEHSFACGTLNFGDLG